MAHNNGMVPQNRGSRGKSRPGKASDNAAKFEAAVQAGPSLAEAANIDPAYLAPPLAAMTAGGTFIPHRPARPEKSEGGRKFKLVSEYQPAGDQPTAIAELVKGVEAEERDQVLLGVTGSGKTFTMAQVIARTQRPALILAPNKTLAAQLYTEFKQFFPENAVEYFVSYYDYYQPEAYIPRTDTYIEKDSSINEEIDRMRHSATRAILERRRCHHRRLGVVHLRHRLGRDLFRHRRLHRARRQDRPQRRHRRTGGAAIPPQRRQFHPRRLPGARRHHRHFPGPLRGPRLAGGAVRRCGGYRSPNSIP